jgi:hypothetical protein
VSERGRRSVQIASGKPDRAHIEHLILIVLHARSPHGGQNIRLGNPKSDALSTELRARGLRLVPRSLGASDPMLRVAVDEDRAL